MFSPPKNKKKRKKTKLFNRVNQKVLVKNRVLIASPIYTFISLWQ